MVVPSGEALGSLLDRADESGAARQLLSSLSGPARDGMMKLFARLYRAGMEDGVDRALELSEEDAPPEPEAVPVEVPEVDEIATSAGVRSAVQTVVERYRNSQLTLPRPPEIATRLNTLLQDKEFEITRVVDLVRGEPTLTASVMRLASSPAFSLSNRAPSNLTDAVMRIGSQELTRYLIAMCNRRLFSFRSEWSADALRDLWHHSLATSLIAEQLARDAVDLHPPTCFLHGLLHDVGRAVLIQIFDELAAEPEYEDAFGEEEVRRTIDGLHGQFGSTLLQKWRFAESFSEVAMFHHTPQKSFAHKTIVSLVALADVVACRLGFGNERVEFGETDLAKHPAAEELGISSAQIDYASAQMKRSFEVMADLT